MSNYNDKMKDFVDRIEELTQQLTVQDGSLKSNSQASVNLEKMGLNENNIHYLTALSEKLNALGQIGEDVTSHLNITELSQGISKDLQELEATVDGRFKQLIGKTQRSVKELLQDVDFYQDAHRSLMNNLSLTSTMGLSSTMSGFANAVNGFVAKTKDVAQKTDALSTRISESVERLKMDASVSNEHGVAFINKKTAQKLVKPVNSDRKFSGEQLIEDIISSVNNTPSQSITALQDWVQKNAKHFSQDGYDNALKTISEIRKRFTKQSMSDADYQELIGQYKTKIFGYRDDNNNPVLLSKIFEQGLKQSYRDHVFDAKNFSSKGFDIKKAEQYSTNMNEFFDALFGSRNAISTQQRDMRKQMEDYFNGNYIRTRINQIGGNMNNVSSEMLTHMQKSFENMMKSLGQSDIGTYFKLSRSGDSIDIGLYDYSRANDIFSKNANGDTIADWNKMTKLSLGLPGKNGNFQFYGMNLADNLRPFFDAKTGEYGMQTFSQRLWEEMMAIITGGARSKGGWAEAIRKGNHKQAEQMINRSLRDVAEGAVNSDIYRAYNPNTVSDIMDDVHAGSSAAQRLSRSNRFDLIDAIKQTFKYGGVDINNANIQRAMEYIFANITAPSIVGSLSTNKNYEGISNSFGNLKKLSLLLQQSAPHLGISSLKEEGFGLGTLAGFDSSAFGPFVAAISGQYRGVSQGTNTTNPARLGKRGKYFRNAVMRGNLGGFGEDFIKKFYESPEQQVTNMAEIENIGKVLREIYEDANTSEQDIDNWYKRYFGDDKKGLTISEKRKALSERIMPSTIDGGLVTSDSIANALVAYRPEQKVVTLEDLQALGIDVLPDEYNSKRDFVHSTQMKELYKKRVGKHGFRMSNGSILEKDDVLQSLSYQNGEYLLQYDKFLPSDRYPKFVTSSGGRFTNTKNNQLSDSEYEAILIRMGLQGYNIAGLVEPTKQSSRKLAPQVQESWEGLFGILSQNKIGVNDIKTALETGEYNGKKLQMTGAESSLLREFLDFKDDGTIGQKFKNLSEIRNRFSEGEFTQLYDTFSSSGLYYKLASSLLGEDVAKTLTSNRVHAATLNKAWEYDYFEPIGSASKDTALQRSHVRVTDRELAAIERNADILSTINATKDNLNDQLGPTSIYRAVMGQYTGLDRDVVAKIEKTRSALANTWNRLMDIGHNAGKYVIDDQDDVSSDVNYITRPKFGTNDEEKVPISNTWANLFDYQNGGTISRSDWENTVLGSVQRARSDTQTGMYWSFGKDAQGNAIKARISGEDGQNVDLDKLYIPYLEPDAGKDEGTVISNYGGLNSAYRNVYKAVEALKTLDADADPDLVEKAQERLNSSVTKLHSDIYNAVKSKDGLTLSQLKNRRVTNATPFKAGSADISDATRKKFDLGNSVIMSEGHVRNMLRAETEEDLVKNNEILQEVLRDIMLESAEKSGASMSESDIDNQISKWIASSKGQITKRFKKQNRPVTETDYNRGIESALINNILKYTDAYNENGVGLQSLFNRYPYSNSLGDQSVRLRTNKDISDGMAIVDEALAKYVNMDYDGDVGYIKMPQFATVSKEQYRDFSKANKQLENHNKLAMEYLRDYMRDDTNSGNPETDLKEAISKKNEELLQSGSQLVGEDSEVTEFLTSVLAHENKDFVGTLSNFAHSVRLGANSMDVSKNTPEGFIRAQLMDALFEPLEQDAIGAKKVVERLMEEATSRGQAYSEMSKGEKEQFITEQLNTLPELVEKMKAIRDTQVDSTEQQMAIDEFLNTLQKGHFLDMNKAGRHAQMFMSEAEATAREAVENNQDLKDDEARENAYFDILKSAGIDDKYVLHDFKGNKRTASRNGEEVVAGQLPIDVYRNALSHIINTYARTHNGRHIMREGTNLLYATQGQYDTDEDTIQKQIFNRYKWMAENQKNASRYTVSKGSDLVQSGTSLTGKPMTEHEEVIHYLQLLTETLSNLGDVSQKTASSTRSFVNAQEQMRATLENSWALMGNSDTPVFSTQYTQSSDYGTSHKYNQLIYNTKTGSWELNKSSNQGMTSNTAFANALLGKTGYNNADELVMNNVLDPMIESLITQGSGMTKDMFVTAEDFNMDEDVFTRHANDIMHREQGTMAHAQMQASNALYRTLWNLTHNYDGTLNEFGTKAMGNLNEGSIGALLFGSDGKSGLIGGDGLGLGTGAGITGESLSTLITMFDGNDDTFNIAQKLKSIIQRYQAAFTRYRAYANTLGFGSRVDNEDQGYFDEISLKSLMHVLSSTGGRGTLSEEEAVGVNMFGRDIGGALDLSYLNKNGYITFGDLKNTRGFSNSNILQQLILNLEGMAQYSGIKSTIDNFAQAHQGDSDLVQNGSLTEKGYLALASDVKASGEYILKGMTEEQRSLYRDGDDKDKEQVIADSARDRANFFRSYHDAKGVEIELLHAAEDGGMKVYKIVAQGMNQILQLISSALVNGGQLSPEQIRNLKGFVTESPIGGTYAGNANVNRGYQNTGSYNNPNGGVGKTDDQQKAVKDALTWQKQYDQAELKLMRTQKLMENNGNDPRALKTLSARLAAEKDVLATLERQKVTISDTGEVYRATKNEVTGLYEMQNTGVKLSSEQLKKYTQESDLAYARQAASIKRVQTQTRTLGSFISEVFGNMKHTLRYITNTSLAYGFIGKIRQGFSMLLQTAQQLNQAIVNLQIATGDSADKARDNIKVYNELAKSLGKTTMEAAAAANDWLRAGYKAEEAANLIEQSLKLSTLGQIDSAKATEYLISTMKGWKLEVGEVSQVVDELTSLDLKYATSAGDIAQAMAKANVSAQLAGFDRHSFEAMLTTVMDVGQQGADVVGTAFKTLMARYGNVKSGKYAKSFSTDGEVDENTSKLNEVEVVLNKIGVTTRDSIGTFRDMQSVLDEIGSKWNSYDQVTQNAITTAMAGTRQREVLNTLFENYDEVAKARKIAENSTGNSNKKMEAYTQSVAAAKSRITSAVEGVVSGGRMEQILIKIYNLGADLISNLDKILLVVAPLVGILKARQIGRFGIDTINRFGMLGNNAFSGIKNRISGFNLRNLGESIQEMTNQVVNSKFAEELDNLAEHARETSYSMKQLSQDAIESAKSLLVGMNKEDRVGLGKLNEDQRDRVLKAATQFELSDVKEAIRLQEGSVSATEDVVTSKEQEVEAIINTTEAKEAEGNTERIQTEVKQENIAAEQAESEADIAGANAQSAETVAEENAASVQNLTNLSLEELNAVLSLLTSNGNTKLTQEQATALKGIIGQSGYSGAAGRSQNALTVGQSVASTAASASSMGLMIGSGIAGRKLGKKIFSGENAEMYGSMVGSMGTMALGGIGGAIGTALGGPLGGAIGQLAGSVGGFIATEVLGNALPKTSQEMLEESKKSNEQLSEMYEKIDDISGKMDKLKDSEGTWYKLIRGIDSATGKNISLNNEEWSTYQEILSNLIDANDDLYKAYDENGNLIAKQAGNIVDLNTLMGNTLKQQEEQIRRENYQIAHKKSDQDGLTGYYDAGLGIYERVKSAYDENTQGLTKEMYNDTLKSSDVLFGDYAVGMANYWKYGTIDDGDNTKTLSQIIQQIQEQIKGKNREEAINLIAGSGYQAQVSDSIVYNLTAESLYEAAMKWDDMISEQTTRTAQTNKEFNDALFEAAQVYLNGEKSFVDASSKVQAYIVDFMSNMGVSAFDENGNLLSNTEVAQIYEDYVFQVAGAMTRWLEDPSHKARMEALMAFDSEHATGEDIEKHQKDENQIWLETGAGEDGNALYHMWKAQGYDVDNAKFGEQRIFDENGNLIEGFTNEQISSALFGVSRYKTNLNKLTKNGWAEETLMGLTENELNALYKYRNDISDTIDDVNELKARIDQLSSAGPKTLSQTFAQLTNAIKASGKAANNTMQILNALKDNEELKKDNAYKVLDEAAKMLGVDTEDLIKNIGIFGDIDIFGHTGLSIKDMEDKFTDLSKIIDDLNTDGTLSVDNMNTLIEKFGDDLLPYLNDLEKLKKKANELYGARATVMASPIKTALDKNTQVYIENVETLDDLVNGEGEIGLNEEAKQILLSFGTTDTLLQLTAEVQKNGLDEKGNLRSEYMMTGPDVGHKTGEQFLFDLFDIDTSGEYENAKSALDKILTDRYNNQGMDVEKWSYETKVANWLQFAAEGKTQQYAEYLSLQNQKEALIAEKKVVEDTARKNAFSKKISDLDAEWQRGNITLQTYIHSLDQLRKSSEATAEQQAEMLEKIEEAKYDKISKDFQKGAVSAKEFRRELAQLIHQNTADSADYETMVNAYLSSFDSEISRLDAMKNILANDDYEERNSIISKQIDEQIGKVAALKAAGQEESEAYYNAQQKVQTLMKEQYDNDQSRLNNELKLLQVHREFLKEDDYQGQIINAQQQLSNITEREALISSSMFATESDRLDIIKERLQVEKQIYELHIKDYDQVLSRLSKESQLYSENDFQTKNRYADLSIEELEKKFDYMTKTEEGIANSSYDEIMDVIIALKEQRRNYYNNVLSDAQRQVDITAGKRSLYEPFQTDNSFAAQSDYQLKELESLKLKRDQMINGRYSGEFFDETQYLSLLKQIEDKEKELRDQSLKPIQIKLEILQAQSGLIEEHDWSNRTANVKKQLLEYQREYDVLVESEYTTEQEIYENLQKQADVQKTLQEIEKEKVEYDLSKTETYFNSYNTLIQYQIDLLSKRQKEIRDYYDEEISKLEEANDQRKRSIELLKLQQELENAKKEKTMVYVSGVGFQAQVNKAKVKEAQQNLDNYLDDRRLSDLKNSQQKEIDLVQEVIDDWSDMKELVEWAKQTGEASAALQNLIDTGFLQGDTTLQGGLNQIRNLAESNPSGKIISLGKQFEDESSFYTSNKEKMQIILDNWDTNIKSIYDSILNDSKNGLAKVKENQTNKADEIKQITIEADQANANTISEAVGEIPAGMEEVLKEFGEADDWKKRSQEKQADLITAIDNSQSEFKNFRENEWNMFAKKYIFSGDFGEKYVQACDDLTTLAGKPFSVTVVTDTSAYDKAIANVEASLASIEKVVLSALGTSFTVSPEDVRQIKTSRGLYSYASSGGRFFNLTKLKSEGHVRQTGNGFVINPGAQSYKNINELINDTGSKDDIDARAYSSGIENGPVNYTGLAMLHGTPGKPEYVLNSDQAYTLLKNLATVSYTPYRAPSVASYNNSHEQTVVYQFGDVHLPNVQKPDEFFDELLRMTNTKFGTIKTNY